ncbi:MAG: MBL fold metallo-hydrolase [Bdellovibrionales bacterium]|nr:MBL fold metallo-hydrolase [Bdellovibrionales bacterium]
MRFSVLSSGSKANCTFLEAGNTRILIDCGLSAKQTELRLTSLGINPASIDAIILTHEHSDHIRGLSVFSRKWKTPIYANQATANFLKNVFAVENFESNSKFSLGSLLISSFSIIHDAHDPVAFCIESEGLKFSHATDLGKVTPQVRDALYFSNALVLESNHDVEMLETCFYPWEVKQRISSNYGHLSNEQAGELLRDIYHPELLHLVLGHISENSNTHTQVIETVSNYLNLNHFQTFECGNPVRPTDLIEVGETISVAYAGG